MHPLMTLSSQRPSLIHCRNNAGCVFFADQVPEPYSPVDRKGWHSQTIWVMRISINGGTPSSLDGLFHGKSKSKMDDLVIPPHLGNLHIYIYPYIIYKTWEMGLQVMASKNQKHAWTGQRVIWIHMSHMGMGQVTYEMVSYNVRPPSYKLVYKPQ